MRAALHATAAATAPAARHAATRAGALIVARIAIAHAAHAAVTDT
eukprot:gene9812-2163_t